MSVTSTVSKAQKDELKKVKKKPKKTQILLDRFKPFIIVVFIECDPKVKKEMKERKNQWQDQKFRKESSRRK